MTEAYEIGITLALQNGVSDGIAVIRRDLATLDRAIAATSANLAHLHQAETSPPRAPALPPKPSPGPSPQAGEPVITSIPAKPQFIAGQPATEPTKGPPSSPAPTVTFDLASPTPAPIPVSTPSPRAPPIGTPQTLSPPLIPIPPAAPTRLTSPSVPTSPDISPPPFQLDPTPSYSRPTPPQGNQPAAFMPLATLAHQSSPASLPRASVSAPTSPSLAPITQYREPSQTTPIAPAPSRTVPTPVVTPRPSVPPPHQPTRSAPAAPAFQHAPSSGNFPRPDQPTAVSHAPPTQTSPPITLQGDITLDGARVGRWMASTLARQAARPAAGPTGPDPRQTPLWSGQAQGY